MCEPEEAATRHEQVVIELKREIAVHLKALLKECDRLGHLVVGPQYCRVAPRPPGSDVAAFENAHLRDPMFCCEVVGSREPMPPTADHNDVIGSARVSRS